MQPHPSFRTRVQGVLKGALNRDRLSIPTFMNPNYHALVECIQTCTGPDNPQKYDPVLAGEYVYNKIRANQGYKAPVA